MNDLTERLQRLADAGADGIAVNRPEPAGPRRPWWRRLPVLAVAAVAVAVAVGSGALLARHGDDDGERVIADDPAATGTEALVAVTYGDGSIGSALVEDGQDILYVDLTLRFLDADRQVIAERSWSEVGERMAYPPDQIVAMEGLVQRVPAGALELEAALRQADVNIYCTERFSVAAGDRLILRVQLGLADGGAQCAQIETVEDWVGGRTSATGAPLVGLSRPEAEARATADGLTTRVVALDGIDLTVTLDLRPDRLNLVLFDGIVVAAQLDGEEPMANPPDPVPVDPSNAGGDPGATPTGEGTLAVDLEPGQFFFEGFDVTLRFYDPAGQLIAEREWSAAVAAADPSDDPDTYYAYVLREIVPAGRIRLVTFMRISGGGPIPPPQGSGCETTVDVGADDAARVTLLFGWDDVSDACAAVSSATAEADELLGMPRGLPAPGFVGLTEDEATAEAEARGWTIRVLARDGEFVSEGITDDYQPERVNLVLEDGVIAAAART